MDPEQYSIISDNKNLYFLIMDFIENTSDIDDSYLSLIGYFETYNYKENEDKLSFVLNLISKIAENHYRTVEFFDKIERIILYFANEITQFFTNTTIYDIFKNNKRVLAFLLKEKILIVDDYIYDHYNCQTHINSEYDLFFFFPEFESFCGKSKKLEKMKNKFLKNDPNWFDTFEEKRKMGENDSYICQLIRKDLVEEFIIYTNKNNISLNKPIMLSVFETNSLLLKKSPTIIEYASFFGAIQIFQYLYFNNVEVNQSLWIYAIHSQNAELIHLLENYDITPPNNSYLDCLLESIKCHHNNIAEYIINSLLDQNDYENEYYTEYSSFIATNFNISYISLPNDFSGLISQQRSNEKINLSHICIFLNKFTISPSVTSIGSGAFKNCNTLKEIFIPPSVTSIGSDAFSDCTSLLHICIPSIHSIESGTFQRCCSLKEVIIPPSVTSIGSNAFKDCTSLIKVLIPSSVISIGDEAFSGCSMLREISIPSSVTEIGCKTFQNCMLLLKIEIPSSVEILRYHLFYGCLSMTEVSIDSKTKFENNVFMKCTSLKTIIVTGNKNFVLLKRFGIIQNVEIVHN